MTIAYNLGIPASANNPSVDQPNMLTNNDNIATYLAIDHVPFNTSGSGQHEQVTFNSNNVPSVPTSPSVLFTNTVAGLPQLFFYSGDAAHSSSQYSAANPGSSFLLGGMIVKWGTVGANDDMPVSFVSAFPNNCFAVSATVSAADFSGAAVVIIKTLAVGSFTPRIAKLSGSTISGTLSYVAIGN